VFAAGGAWAWSASSRRWSYVVGVLLLLHVASSARAYPNYMAYANELWGGPSKTYKYLTDSNTDWAQQLVAVKKYTDEHGIKDCWFAYFADPFLRAEDYGIPCKPLPTPDSWFSDVQHPVPTTITGPVLISAGTLTGFELGSSVLNPYGDFEKLKPTTSIQDGVLVFEGTFQVSLASALSYVQESKALREKKDFAGALTQAQQAVTIAPDAVQTQVALGDALMALGQKDEARVAYGRAMELVKTMEPGAREEWAARMEKKIASVG
jgi:tetratricopeptide (TPR) repeat protein